MDELASLGILFVVALISPLICHRMRIPVIVGELIFGLILGQSFLKLITVVNNQWIEFFSTFGLIYLLFLAGLEVEFEMKEIREISIVALPSIVLPFMLGYLLGTSLGVNPFFLGAVLSTTSVGIALPVSRELSHIPRFSEIYLGTAVIVDVASVILLAFSLELFHGGITYTMLFALLFIFGLFVIPVALHRFELGRRIARWASDKRYFEPEVRMCFALIAILSLASQFFGFHAIIGAFIAGLIVTELTERGGELEQKLTSFGYGFFIPFFFLTIGIKTNIPVLLEEWDALLLLAGLLLIGLIGKVAGVGVGCKLVGFSSRESLSMGILSGATFTLVMAAAEIGRGAGMIGDASHSALVLFALITTTVYPIVGKFLVKPAPPVLLVEERAL